MGNSFYLPFLWVLFAVLVFGIMAIINVLANYRKNLNAAPEWNKGVGPLLQLLKTTQMGLGILALAITTGGILLWGMSQQTSRKEILAQRVQRQPIYEKTKLWTAPDPFLAETDPKASLIAYGRDLIARTQDYFGEKGLIKPGHINALNCQNCHLDAGAKPFGNNYFAVQSTYPQIRARSGGLETIPKRINDCFLRSLNGQALDTSGREMLAMQAYIEWLGTGVPKGEKPKGAGLLQLPFLDRPADPELGHQVYVVKCATCHGLDGQGLPMPNSPRYYPPLWGDKSYNEGAGLFRLSRFAGYVKANMPLGASFDSPQLSDEEAWDLAAYVNSKPRPGHPFLANDWPVIAQKPFDHPFGPFADTFPDRQHKYGPFGPIVAFQQSTQKKK